MKEYKVREYDENFDNLFVPNHDSTEHDTISIIIQINYTKSHQMLCRVSFVLNFLYLLTFPNRRQKTQIKEAKATEGDWTAQKIV